MTWPRFGAQAPSLHLGSQHGNHIYKILAKANNVVFKGTEVVSPHKVLLQIKSPRQGYIMLMLWTVFTLNKP